MPSKLTGNETPLDIVNLAIAAFLADPRLTPLKSKFKIDYPDGVPVLQFDAQVKQDLGDFRAMYRLDKMLLRLFPVCESVYEEFCSKGILKRESETDRKDSIDNLALFAMQFLLMRLVFLQVAMFEENAEENKFLITSVLYYAAAKVAEEENNIDKIKSQFNLEIRALLNKTINAIAKKKRTRLAQLLNQIVFFSIPVSIGRPPGSTKPDEKKRQEAAEFEVKIEQAIRKLKAASKGKMPTQKRVAEEMGIGGLGSRASAFSNKLRRDGIDYAAIAARVKLDK